MPPEIKPPTPRLPQMTRDEIVLLTSFLACSKTYLEFGCGGSTLLAAGLVKQAVYSVESSLTWIEQMAAECAGLPNAIAPTFIHAYIGLTGEWGMPSDPAMRPHFPLYHTSVWADEATSQADLVLVDGRFRVACFLQAILRCRADTMVIIHDYVSRPNYHAIAPFARKVAVRDDMAVFIRRRDYDLDVALEVLGEHQFDPR